MALSSSEHLDEADKKLEAMGYKPVFKREFSSWSTFSFAMSISGIYGSLISTWVYGLQAGGAAAIMWSWIVGGAGALALAVSLAELSSAYPNAGAMYYTLRFLAPEKHMPLLCWMSGWITLIGTIAGSASTEYATSQMLLGAISIATNSTYKPTVGHVVGAMALLTLIHAGINTLPTLWLTRLTSSYVVLHMTVLVSACVYLLVQTKNKNSLAYAFTDFQPTSGWSPPGFAILFGCLTPAWIMTSADSTARIAEEAKSPALTIPRAIFVASLSTYILGFVFNLVLVLCMGPGGPFPLLNSPSGQPVVELFTQALGRAPAIFFTLCGVIIMNMVAIPGAQAGSRMVFALARDELVPLARMWTRVDVKRGTPILAVWGYAVAVVIVSLLGLLSEIAIAAVFTVCAIALNVSYLLPILCKMMYPSRFERGPWHLGRWSIAVNVIAVLWNIFIAIILFLPLRLPVTPSNMNYAIVVFISVVICACCYWAHGRNYYMGPGTQSLKPSHSTTGTTTEVGV